jgi:alkanesulfonate monooxygenase SsuD/methylene tetrahydromethanopterin reductase-like flavin-dependent oxidoreductase (luciferase family)
LPLQEAGPPLLVGAFADVGVRRAGRIGNGWIAPELRHVGGLRKRLALLDLAQRTEPFHIALTINAFVAARDAWDTVRPGVEQIGRQYREWMAESGDVPKLADKSFEHEGDSSGKPPQFIAGTPEDCVTQLLPWWQELAALPHLVTPHITLRMTFPGVPAKATFESLRLLGEEVVPALRELCPRSPSGS